MHYLTTGLAELWGIFRQGIVALLLFLNLAGLVLIVAAVVAAVI